MGFCDPVNSPGFFQCIKLCRLRSCIVTGVTLAVVTGNFFQGNAMFVCLRNLCSRLLAAPCMCVLLAGLMTAAGCGGGGGGVGIADGQDGDPVVVDVPIAYVKRPVPADDDEGNPAMPDVRELLTFNAGTVGADLYVRERASPTAEEINVTAAETQGLGDVRDVEASWDGEFFLFAMRGPFDPNLDEEEQPTWNIWEYEIATQTLRRVIASNNTAAAGHDLAPHYLPDGRIVFSSTRQRRTGAILLDEGKPQYPGLDESQQEPAFVLHVMNADGSDIRQVSFNQSHDLDPSVDSDGKVIFSRWDNAGPMDAMNLYRMNPDGSDLELLYGAHSHATGTNAAVVQFLQPREMPDGRMITVLRPFATPQLGGDLTLIDTPRYLENTQANAANSGVLSGPAQVSAVINDVRTDGGISPGGSFSAAFPLWDGTNRIIVSWSQCRLQEAGQVVPCTPAKLAGPNPVAASPAYGIWVYDISSDTQLPIVPAETGRIFTDVVAAQTRGIPPIILDLADSGLADLNLLAEGTALINVRSVYDMDGVDTAAPNIPSMADPLVLSPDQSPKLFMRIVKAVAIPDADVLDFNLSAFGVSRQNGMREIIGYVPVQPDGSVLAKVPANVPLQISVLDRQGQRLDVRHNSWLQLRPGQELTCNGCHVPDAGLSHGRADAFASVYAGATTTGLPFPNTNPAIFADFGETMAEARGRISCATDCADITPSMDVIFTDVWTDPAGPQVPADSFSYLYADLTTAAPVSPACQTQWTPLCRTVINYETHIQPLWDLPRVAADGVTDVTCILCHDKEDDMGNPEVPAGQLDLRGIASPEQALHFVAYRELLFGDNLEFFDMDLGIVTDVLVDDIDPDTGLPIQVPVPIPSPASAGGARSSGPFFLPFQAGNTHEGWLTDAELRLISEWLDVGAQYFNNPFEAPLN